MKERKESKRQKESCVVAHVKTTFPYREIRTVERKRMVRLLASLSSCAAGGWKMEADKSTDVQSPSCWSKPWGSLPRYTLLGQCISNCLDKCCSQCTWINVTPFPTDLDQEIRCVYCILVHLNHYLSICKHLYGCHSSNWNYFTDFCAGSVWHND